MASRTIIVTGGFGALGSAVAAAFAAAGERVARVDFAPTPSQPLAGALDLGGVDLTVAADAGRVIDRVVAEFGGVDGLVNIAGGFVWQTLEDGGPDVWARMFAMNATTCVTMTKAALPALLKAADARIVNIGANAATQPAGAGMGAYAASKAAVHRLTESLAAELAGRDITVNAVLPSIIDTPANRAAVPDVDAAAWVQPASIAEVIQFLASPAARSISGALIPVTRGG